MTLFGWWLFVLVQQIKGCSNFDILLDMVSTFNTFGSFGIFLGLGLLVAGATQPRHCFCFRLIFRLKNHINFCFLFQTNAKTTIFCKCAFLSYEVWSCHIFKIIKKCLFNWWIDNTLLHHKNISEWTVVNRTHVKERTQCTVKGVKLLMQISTGFT